MGWVYHPFHLIFFIITCPKDNFWFPSPNLLYLQFLNLVVGSSLQMLMPIESNSSFLLTYSIDFPLGNPVVSGFIKYPEPNNFHSPHCHHWGTIHQVYIYILRPPKIVAFQRKTGREREMNACISTVATIQASLLLLLPSPNPASLFNTANQ